MSRLPQPPTLINANLKITTKVAQNNVYTLLRLSHHNLGGHHMSTAKLPTIAVIAYIVTSGIVGIASAKTLPHHTINTFRLTANPTSLAVGSPTTLTVAVPTNTPTSAYPSGEFVTVSNAQSNQVVWPYPTNTTASYLFTTPDWQTGNSTSFSSSSANSWSATKQGYYSLSDITSFNGIATHPTTHKVSTLRESILSPVTTKLAHAVMADKVYTSTGKLVSLPRNRPDLFTAWWCPHCHAALLQLKTEHDLNKFNLVSIYVYGDTTKPVTTWKRAFALTEDALRKIGVSIPASHIYLAMPDSSLNTQIKGVPALWEFSKRGVRELVGTPSTASVWRQTRL
jgi:hypothetical protein